MTWAWLFLPTDDGFYEQLENCCYVQSSRERQPRCNRWSSGRQIAAELQRAGYRTVAPWLRGFGATRFLDAATPRDGRAAAISTDALDLMDHLRIERFHVVGHDWARVAYALSALAPERIASATALSVAYAAHAAFKITDFDQARRWWYQFFMSSDEGARRISADPIGFGRVQWDTWSPSG